MLLHHYTCTCLKPRNLLLQSLKEWALLTGIVLAFSHPAVLSSTQLFGVTNSIRFSQDKGFRDAKFP